MRKLFSLTLHKLRVLVSGRLYVYPVLLAALFALFPVVRLAVTAEARDEVLLAAVDECRGELSTELMLRLSELEGCSVQVFSDRDEGETSLLEGRREALLIINEGYDEWLATDELSGLITVIVSPSSVSGSAVRETVSGLVLSQRARARALAELEADGFDTAEFDEFYAEFDAPKLWSEETSDGTSPSRAVFLGGFTGYNGFAALVMLLIVLTLSKPLGGRESSLVSERLLATSSLSTMPTVSSFLALFIASLAVGLVAFIFAPDKGFALIPAHISYSFCLAGGCLMLSLLMCGGRIDVLSPVIALATALLGGCFADLSSLSPALRILSLLTPEGQFIRAAAQSPAFSALLIAEGLLFAVLADVRIKKRK